MCNCVKRINAKLAEHNARLAFGFTFKENSMNLSPPLLQIEKIDKSKRNKPPVVMAAFCPFCGKHWKPELLTVRR